MQSLFSLQAFRSASSSGTGSANEQTSHSHTREAKPMGSESCGPTWSDINSQTSSLAVSQMRKVKQQVILAATQNLFSKDFFDICKLHEIAKVVGASKNSGHAWDLLQALHCVHYKTMPPDLRNAIPQLVNECLTAGRDDVIDVQAALKGVRL